MTLLNDDGDVALSQPIWIKTMQTYQSDPTSSEVVRQLASMCEQLIEINQHDPETIGYLNERARIAMNEGHLFYDQS